MNERDTFDRILASLHEAALDDARWAETSALIPLCQHQRDTRYLWNY